MSKRLARRRFSQASVAAGLAAFAAPYVVPFRALGANDKVVLGLIGVGNRGTDLRRGLRGRSQVQTCSPDRDPATV